MVTTLSEMIKLWEKALKKIKLKLNDDASFEYFFSNSYIYEKNGSNIVVVVDKKVAKAVILNKYSKLVLDSLSELEDEDFQLTVISDDEIASLRKSSSKEESKPSKASEEIDFFPNSKLNATLTFDNFVVGDFNKDAHKAALFVAKNGGTLYNPLFIYSNSGLGKTHLLHAIGNEVRENRIPNAKILYIAANEFVEAYVKYVRAELDSRSLKDYFNGVDILLFDDIQFLAEKVKTQEMFFQIYQSLVNSGKRIILTSDRQPSELKGLEDRLVTRFTQGLTVKINEPDIETCVEILKRVIIKNGLKIENFDSEVLYFLAEKFSKNVRELEGAFNSLLFRCDVMGSDKVITIDDAIKAVSYIKGGKQIASQLTERKIINTVADYYNLTPSQITGKDRNAQIVLARHISMYLIRNNIDIPLKKIGEMFCGKDHTTVMSAITKVDKELKTNEQLQTAIKELEKKIRQ